MKILALSILLIIGFSTLAQSIDIRIGNQDGMPIPSSRIFFGEFDQYYLADSAGQCHIELRDTGTYNLVISAYGFMTLKTEIKVLGDSVYQFKIKENHRELDQLIVQHTGELQGENITNISHLKLADLNQIQTTTLGASLANIPGVYQTGLGNGISKPVIRGLSGSRVVTYVNSLRIENQQWGGDHGLPITSLGIGSVEVIKGPASLLFGADALGGVLYFVDEPYAPKNSSSLIVSSRFESNTMGTSNQLGYKFNKNKIRTNIYLGYDNHADYQLPNGNYVRNSRFNQYSGKFSLGYNTKKWLVNLRYNFYQGELGLPGHTHDSLPNPATFQSENQNRKATIPNQFVTNNFLSMENKFFFARSELAISLGNTNNRLKEFEEKFFSPAIQINLNNTLLNAKWTYKVNDKTKLILGSQEMVQINKNAVEAEEQLIPNSNTLDMGGFALLISSVKKWRFQGGIRMDNRNIETNDGEFSRNFTGYNFAIGAARLADQSTLRFNVSSGFRAPTSAELLSDGAHHGAFRYERGNANLATEKAVQFDLSYALHYDDLEIIVNPFYNRIFDYVYLQNAGEVLDGYPVYNYVQTNFAQLYGLDIGFHYHPHGAHWLHLESNFSTLFAEDQFKQPLPLIPQSRLNSQVRVDFKWPKHFDALKLILQHNYSFLQNRVGLFETFTNNFQVFNIGLNGKLKGSNPLIMGLGVNNLFNENYINHLSGLKNFGLPNPGRNFYISLKYEFTKQLKIKINETDR
ncbi:TonB-dependent receptor [Crocinitomix sp.]|nr:TonB-dependent receptor [Crocinitomix sp.]